MKVRTSFVSNSGSSSFIAISTDNDITLFGNKSFLEIETNSKSFNVDTGLFKC